MLNKPEAPASGDLFGPIDPEARDRTTAMRIIAENTARKLRDAGMFAAVQHADAVSPAWSELAYQHVRDYALLHETLTSEEVQREAEKLGLPAPPDARAWGSVMTRAARAGVIVRGEFGISANPKAHMRPIITWRSKVKP